MVLLSIGLVGAAFLLHRHSADRPRNAVLVPVDPPLNLLLVSVDTIRSDHLGYEGYPRATSPHIDGLAREGIVFRNAYSQSGWTLPSMATIMTGLYPHQHGATRLDTRIRASVPTLALMLGRAGYDSRAYVSHYLVDATHQLDRGFDHFDSSVLGLGNPAKITTSKALTDLAISDLDRIREPWFLWIHYFDPHLFFLPHQDFRFGAADLDRYDGEIAHNDHQIGRLLAALEERDLLDRTVVVFTADHGEEFGEHGGLGHFTLYEEVLRIPLVVRSPRAGPLTVELPVGQIDVLPTLLPLLGFQVPPGFPGRNTLADSAAPSPIFAERTQPATFRQRTVISGGFKLIYIDRNPHPPSYAGKIEYEEQAKLAVGLRLFEIRSDPGETTDLIDERPDVARDLLALLQSRFVEIAPAEGTIELTKERLDELRELGYIE